MDSDITALLLGLYKGEVRERERERKLGSLGQVGSLLDAKAWVRISSQSSKRNTHFR